MGRGFVIAAVVVAVAIGLFMIGAAALPEERLRDVEAIPVKRFLLAALGINLLLVTLAAYHMIVLPTPPRVTWTVITSVAIPLIFIVFTASARPEECRFEISPIGLPVFTLKFGGFNLASVAIIGMFLWFTRSLVFTYDAQYRAQEGGSKSGEGTKAV